MPLGSLPWDAFDLLGYLVPGAVLLLGLIYLFDNIHDLFLKDDIRAFRLLMFLVVAYIAGNVLHGLAGEFIEKPILAHRSGFPQAVVIEKKQELISELERERLKTSITRRYSHTLEFLDSRCRTDPELKKEDSELQKPKLELKKKCVEVVEAWDDLFARMRFHLINADRYARVGVFLRQYNLFLGLAAAFTALALVAAALFASNLYGRNRKAKHDDPAFYAVLAAVFSVAAGFSVIRMEGASRSFAIEVLRMFNVLHS